MATPKDVNVQTGPRNSNNAEEFLTGLSDAQKFLNNNVPLNDSSLNKNKSDGFAIPARYSADGTGLPFSKVPQNNQARVHRNIITWFVPEFGIVKMYVNPSQIVYSNKKNIQTERTKGGYTLQYWGEGLGKLDISGTTGSSGIEGINVLEEIYRAEQLAFDSTGLTLAANNASADISSNISNSLFNLSANAITSGFQPGGDKAVGALGATGAIGLGILGLDQNNSLAQKNVPSMAQLAFTVEMYYNGWVFRGFFEEFRVTERADNFLMDYSLSFTVTQRRGYRTNYFPWSRSPKEGPSEYNSAHSFSGEVIKR